MNNFYYVLIKNDGEVIHNIFATCHMDLVAKYTTSEDARDKTYFKATYSPKTDHRLDDIFNYHLIINEMYVPEWFQGDFEVEIMKKLQDIISSMIGKPDKKREKRLNSFCETA